MVYVSGFSNLSGHVESIGEVFCLQTTWSIIEFALGMCQYTLCTIGVISLSLQFLWQPPPKRVHSVHLTKMVNPFTLVRLIDCPMGKWSAISSTSDLILNYSGNFMVQSPQVQGQVQPHVFDRWCVGLVICSLWMLGLGVCRSLSHHCLVFIIVCVGSILLWTSRQCSKSSFRECISSRTSKQVRLQFCWKQVSTVACKYFVGSSRLLRLLMVMAFIHSGEAHNPGPTDVSRSHNRSWSLGAFNPSGLCGKHQVIESYLGDCDIWAVSETHLTSRGFSSFRQNLKWSSNFQFCVGGSPVPLRSHSDRTGEWSGVCMISKHPTRQLPVQLPPNTYETSRVLITSTLCADLWISGAVLYGEPPGVKHPDAHQNTDTLAHDLFQQLKPLGGLRFFAGDFNFEKGGIEIFNTLEAAGFRDLQDLAFERWGRGPQKTCKYTTRKDFFFISPELQTYLVDVKVDHTVWADHAIIQGFFSGGTSNLVTHHWRIPTPVEWPEDLTCNIPSEWYQHQQPEVKYTELWKHVEQSASSARVANGKSPLLPKCQGRGRTLEVEFRKAPFRTRPTKIGRRGDVQPTFVGVSQQHAHWFRQLRRLQSFCRFHQVHSRDCDDAHGASLWSSILRAKGFPDGFCVWWQREGAKVYSAPPTLPLIPPTASVARSIYDSFLLDVRHLEKNLCAQRKKFALDRRKELAHLVFQDIRRSCPDRVDVLLHVNTGCVHHIDHDNAYVLVKTDKPLVLDHPVFIDGVQQDVIHIHEQEIWLPTVEGIVIGSEFRQSTFCGAAEDMFRAFELEWKKRWDRHKHVPQSQWNDICTFVRSHLPLIPCQLPAINAQALRGELAQKKKRSASGLDGVSLSDLKAMPDTVLDAHCHLFEQAEVSGSWPQQLVTGKVASLAKVPCPESVQSYRPITVLSHGYRLWSGLRAKFLLSHLHPHCPAFLFGNRPHCQASQVWTYLSWAIEASFADDIPVGGIVADIEKAFNHLSREVVFQTALALGLSHRLLVAWSGALGQLTRRFQIREHTGPALDSCTGLPEGDALSCVGMMLMDFVFHRWFEQSFPLCQPISYVDDLQLLTQNPLQVPQLYDHLLQFAKQVDLTVDNRKTFVWSNSAYHRASFRSQGLSARSHAKGLGAQLQFTRKHSIAAITSRLNDLEPLWQKLRSSPSPYHVKVLAVKQAAWTRGLHGVAASSVSDATYTKLRTLVMRGLGSEGAGCSPVVHMGMVEHPTLDPKCWSVLTTLRTVREAASVETLSRLLAATLDPEIKVQRHGMTSLLVNRLHVLCWSFCQGVDVEDAFGRFSLLSISYPELCLRVSWAWNKVVASEVAHRPSFEGLAFCDPSATRRFFSSLPPVDQGLFRKALNGAHFTQDAICHWSSSGTTICEFCGSQDSRNHRFWFCPVFQSERQHCDETFWELFPSLPPCLTLHGWALRPSTWNDWVRQLLSIELPDMTQAPCPTFTNDGWIDVFSDGSCLWPQQHDLKVAAWAIIQAHPSGEVSSSQVLMAGQVPGVLQSAFRAELLAIHQALRYACSWKKKIRLWSDCQSVVCRLNTMLSDRSPPAVNSNHADLWQDIFEYLECLDFRNAVMITKVAAHQDCSQVVDAAECWAFIHNATADRAARLANLQRTQDFWSLHRKHAQEIERVDYVTRVVQTTILNISRKVILREASRVEDFDPHAPPVHVPPLMCFPAPAWHGFHPKVPLPISITAKYGHRYVAMITAWFQQGLAEAQNTESRWVSIHQLFLDYQFQTGELGPICGKFWTDTALQSRFRLTPNPFRKRSSWFGRSFRAILQAHDCCPIIRVTRPDSEMLALHIPSLAVPWPQWRLTIIEDWLGRHLPNRSAATRNGVQLNHLPPAKRDSRWPSLCLVSGPIGS